MTDILTSKPIQIRTGEFGHWPYLCAPRDQAEKISHLMTSKEIFNDLSPVTFSQDGKPYVRFLWFGRDADAAALQAILDEHEG